MKGFALGFGSGALSLLLVGGLAFYAWSSEPDDARAPEGDILRFGDFFDHRTNSMGAGEAVSYTVTSVRAATPEETADLEEAGAPEGTAPEEEEEGKARTFHFTLGVVNNSDHYMEGQFPDVYCRSGDEHALVLTQEMARNGDGDYPTGLESGVGRLGSTMELACEFSEPLHPEDLAITLERDGDRATFVDPMSVTTRVKWRHVFEG